MQSGAKNPDEYIKELPEDRRKAITELRKIFQKNLPRGFAETMQYGMISYVVPHSLYPAGYHCKPSDALPFISIASQKNHISLYHMALHAEESLITWFKTEYPKHISGKLDVGKSCIRWKSGDTIPYTLISQLAEKLTPSEWIEIYERRIKK